jgi:Skp family chaperone for outer membrane proteins
MLQSKLDGAFAQYHNKVQDMQAKEHNKVQDMQAKPSTTTRYQSDELVRKNKSLRQKNKGMLVSAFRVLIRSTL